ncbi:MULTISPECIES: MFS transporter [unclassified Agrococcus]|uniref:MFS transporter n=1 Tax=unclassified Agrococcus TaxID=2615065 RepID=UPI0036170876
MAAESPVRVPAPVVAVLAAVLLSAFAQMSVQPTSAPMASELGLAPWQVGLAVALSAVMMLLAAPAWMRRMARHGARGPMVLALALAAVAMAAFGTLAMLGARGLVEGWMLVAAILVLRGIALGASLAAIAPAARVVIAAAVDGAARARALAGIATVQGVAVVMGVALGGFLSAFGALVPLLAAPVILAAGALAVALWGPVAPVALPTAPAERARVVDARSWPFAVVALVVLSSVACVQVVLGFVLQERLALDAATTGFATGGMLLVGSLAAVVAQSLIARASERPRVLLRVGVALLAGSLVVLVPAMDVVTMLVAVVAGGIGAGLALSGAARTATLVLGGRAASQRVMGVAGVLGAVAGPAAGTALLAASTSAPFVACVAALALAIALVVAHPAFHSAVAPEPLAEPAAA